MDKQNFTNPKDQLKLTVKRLGKLTPVDLSFVQTKDAFDYFKSLMKDIEDEPNNYLNDLNNTSPDMKDILTSMLEFNPFFRSSAREILKHKIFDDIRIHENERQAPQKLKLEVDADDAFDYETGKSTKFTKEAYLKMIYQEVL